MNRLSALGLTIVLLVLGSSRVVEPFSGWALAAETPRVRIAAPIAGQILGGVVTIRVDVEPPDAVEQVSVSSDATLLGTDTSAPFEVTWDTRGEADGPYVLVATARGAQAPAAVSSRVPVTIDNTPPAVKWLAPADAKIVGGTVTLEAEAHDVIGIRLVRFLVNGEAIGEATVAPYTFAWDTTQMPNIRCGLQIRAIDQANNSTTSEAVTVKVSNPNRYPTLEPIPPQTVIAGTPLAFTLKASDPDGARDPLTYFVANLPPWLTLNAQTGECQGTPPRSEVSLKQPRKDYPIIRFQVCDPEPLCDTKETAITVQFRNRPPVLTSPGDRTVPEGTPLSIKLAATDPDGDPLTCRASLLPPWAKFDEETCTLEGIPGGDVATLNEPKTVYEGVVFEVCDPQPLCAKGTATITVLNTQNRPPQFSDVPAQRVEEGRTLTFTMHIEDPDGETPEVAVVLPRGAAFTYQKEGNWLFQWAPRFDQSGTYNIAVAATDGAVKAAKTVAVTVLEKSLAISGTILTGDHLPFEGVRVQFFSANGQLVQEVTTDETGAFLAADLAPSTYQIRPHYELERTFSAAGRGLSRVVFEPSVQRVTLTDRDVTKTDFSSSITSQ